MTTYRDPVDDDVDTRREGALPSSAELRRSPNGPAARYRAFRRGLRINPVIDLTWRMGVLTVGGLVVAAGIALLALPGPGWATIFIGLMILASEFAWARRSLDWTKERARVAHAKATAPEARRRNQIITAVGLLLAAVVVVWYLQTYGFSGPVGSWFSFAWSN